MHRNTTRSILLCLSLIYGTGIAQTTLYPGDIAVLSMASDLGACGLPPLTDELSFVCFQDIDPGTEIDLTDNGWEYEHANFFGDTEGTLRMTRTGGVIPRGTVITLQCQFIGGNWTYRTLAPDNGWAFTSLNAPNGYFNLDPLGDQVIFMQGGTWSSTGGGANKATYTGGRLLFGANMYEVWDANGTVHGSNLPPELDPCYSFAVSAGLPDWNFVKYIGYLDEASRFKWLDRLNNPSSFITFAGCGGYLSSPPAYPPVLPIEAGAIGIDCAGLCYGCAPYQVWLEFHLPEEGAYTVVYTNGTDTFTLENVVDGDLVTHILMDTTEFWIVEILSDSECPLYSDFLGTPVINVLPVLDPGLYNEIWVCEEMLYPFLDLDYYLNGTPSPGGIWLYAGGQLEDGIWRPANGEGLFTYVVSHGQAAHCIPPFDTASVMIRFFDLSTIDIDVSCDQNGTPNDITDDRAIIIINIPDGHFGPGYRAKVLGHDVQPLSGVTGGPFEFILEPGSATAQPFHLVLNELAGLGCEFEFIVDPPGFCSDPCEAAMSSYLSGPPEDLCVYNCPEVDYTITLDVDQGTAPYYFDFTLSAPGFPDWTFPQVDFSGFDHHEIRICIDSVPGPTLTAGGTLLTLPSSMAGESFLFTLNGVFDKYDCASTMDGEELFFTIHDRPEITSDTLDFCRYEAINLDLTEYDLVVSPFMDVTWYDGDPFFGGEKINNATGVNLENIVDLWAYVEDDYCGNSIRVPFIILPTPDLDSLGAVTLCSGESIVLSALPVVDQGNSMATYTYHSGLPADTSNMLDPLNFIPADSMTIYVLATAGRCTDIIPVDLNVEDYPTFSLDGLPCDIPSGTYTILFSTDTDSIAASVGVLHANPTGPDSLVMIPNDLAVTLILYNSSGLCTDTFQIAAPNCNCPVIAQPVPVTASASICNGEVIPVFTVMAGPGLVVNWYSQPSGGTLLAANTLTFTPAGGGIFYAEAIDPLTSCASIRTPVTLTIHPVADLAPLADPVRCAGETIDLNTLQPGVTNGVAGAGQWIDLMTGLPAGGVIPALAGSAYQYVFTSTGGCLSYDTINPVVHPLPEIVLNLVDCDENALVYTIGFTTTATLVVVNAGNLVHTAGTDSFRVENVPFDTDLIFTLTNETTTCMSTVTLDAPDCSCPPLLQTNNLTLCSSAGTFDLSAIENPGVNGTWTLVGTPTGSQPATLTGSALDITDGDPGAYRLLFVRNIILDNCVDSAFADILLLRSPAADAGADGTSCAPDAIALSGLVDGTNAVIQWQTTGSGSLQNPGSVSTLYTPSLSDFQAGAISFTLTVTDPTGTCPDASETITWTIDADAYYELNTANVTLCDTSSASFDLDQLITFGTTSGSWFFVPDIPGAVQNGSELIPGNVPPGNYIIHYAPASANPPCSIDTTGVPLTIRSCDCPSLALANPPDGLCSAAGSFDLAFLEITTEPGQWSIAGTPAGSNPAVLAGTIFTINNSDAGDYTLRFTLDNPVTGCDSFGEVTLTVSPTPTLSLLAKRCAPDLLSWEATISASTPNIGLSAGQWTSSGAGMYAITGIPPATDLTITVTSDDGHCLTTLVVPFADCECTLSVGGVPASLMLCPDETITVTGQVIDPKGPSTAYWTNGTDTTWQQTLLINAAGSYTFVAMDELGCIASAHLTVSVYPDIVLTTTSTEVTCPGDNDGTISITGFSGGEPPYSISINGGSFSLVTSLPHILGNLGAGNYSLAVMDAASCTNMVMVGVDGPVIQSLSLGQDQTILLGDSLDIIPQLSFVPDTFYWSFDLDGINLLTLNQLLTPERDQVIQLHAVDEKGCVYTDEVRIRVLLDSQLDVPNVFSPNGDGINDILGPSFDPSVTRVVYFEIYDRWGELVYEARDYVPDTVPGWDGSFRGKTVQPGVFVYRVEAVNKRNQVLHKYGDFTLLK